MCTYLCACVWDDINKTPYIIIPPCTHFLVIIITCVLTEYSHMCVCVILFYFTALFLPFCLTPVLSLSVWVWMQPDAFYYNFFKCLLVLSDWLSELNSEHHVPLYGYIFSSRIAFHFFRLPFHSCQHHHHHRSQASKKARSIFPHLCSLHTYH